MEPKYMTKRGIFPLILFAMAGIFSAGVEQLSKILSAPLLYALSSLWLFCTQAPPPPTRHNREAFFQALSV
jgi:hypothetical protein